jgi:hypothetical protein
MRVGLVVFGFALAACGGSDFQAADPGDGATSQDAYHPPVDSGATTHDAPATGDTTSAVDAGGEWRGDDGVPDANGERVVEDATSLDMSVNDTWADGSADAPSVTTCDVRIAFYRDRDGDGFGSTDNSVLACVAPARDDGGAWVTQPGDCRDDLAAVKPFKANSPDPPQYSGTGYLDPARPSGVSFDYDCNGDETADPANQFGAAPTCPALATGCTGTGYLPASPARGGTGVNPLCGSTTLRSCVVQGLNCKEQLIQMATPFRCR